MSKLVIKPSRGSVLFFEKSVQVPGSYSFTPAPGYKLDGVFDSSGNPVPYDANGVVRFDEAQASSWGSLVGAFISNMTELSSKYSFSNLGSDGIFISFVVENTDLSSIFEMSLSNGKCSLFLNRDHGGFRFGYSATERIAFSGGFTEKHNFYARSISVGLEVPVRMYFTARVKGDEALVEVSSNVGNGSISGTMPYYSESDWRVNMLSYPADKQPSGVKISEFLLTGDSVFVDQNQIYQVPVTPEVLSQKFITLPVYGTSNFAVNVSTGVFQVLNEDFVVDQDNRLLRWDGLGMESLLQAGDYIRVIYGSGIGVDESPVYRVTQKSTARFIKNTKQDPFYITGVDNVGDIFCVHAWGDSITGVSSSSWANTNFASAGNYSVGVYDPNTIPRLMTKPQVPMGTRPTKATLRLFVDFIQRKNIDTYNTTLTCRPLLVSWDRNYVTAIMRDQTNMWSVPGCGGSDVSQTVFDENVIDFSTDIGPTNLYSPPVQYPVPFTNNKWDRYYGANEQLYVDIDVTNCVTFIVDSGVNNGIMIEADTHVADPNMPPAFFIFYSSNCADPALRPRLLMEF